jgi:hypothetical protein
MIRMVALVPWINWDREGQVYPGMEFFAPENRARELKLSGLAIPAVGDGTRIKVMADAPADGSPPPRPRPRPRAGKRALLQLAAGADFVRMLDLTADVHARYCAAWGVEFIAQREDRPKKVVRPLHWRKVEMMGWALDRGFEQVLWLDADSIIVDASVDLFSTCTWGVGLCECWDSPTTPRHLNTGVVWLASSDEVRAFVAAWQAMPPHMKWEDQGALIELMNQRRWRNLLTILPNRFNWVEKHMESDRPVVRSFHGERDRLLRMQALLSRGVEQAA